MNQSDLITDRMKKMHFTIIGYVQNNFNEASPYEADIIKKSISKIILNKEFKDGLYKIEKFEKLNILFYFDKSESFDLQTTTRSGEFRGVFASCSPRRPSMIGLTTVNLLKVEDNTLTVTGLDALNNTPVLDIKPVIG